MASASSDNAGANGAGAARATAPSAAPSSVTGGVRAVAAADSGRKVRVFLPLSEKTLEVALHVTVRDVLTWERRKLREGEGGRYATDDPPVAALVHNEMVPLSTPLRELSSEYVGDVAAPTLRRGSHLRLDTDLRLDTPDFRLDTSQVRDPC